MVDCIFTEPFTESTREIILHPNNSSFTFNYSKGKKKTPAPLVSYLFFLACKGFQCNKRPEKKIPVKIGLQG